jgi:hypothetical protein
MKLALLGATGRALLEQLPAAADDLDWTVVRPPHLTSAPLCTDYRLQAGCNFDDDRPLSRASPAHFLLTEAETPRLFSPHRIVV